DPARRAQQFEDRGLYLQTIIFSSHDRGPQPPSWPADARSAFADRPAHSGGIGWVITARFKSNEVRVQAGIFLVDVFCLGAKLAHYEDCDAADYRRGITHHYRSRFPMVATEPRCARKLVEQAVQYAQGLGFAPHPDYKKAARVFGGLRAKQCSQKFTFGHEARI